MWVLFVRGRGVSVGATRLRVAAAKIHCRMQHATESYMLYRLE